MELQTEVPKVRLLKAQLFQALESRERDAWKSYWSTFQQYLLAQRSLQEFHELALGLLGPDQRTYAKKELHGLAPRTDGVWLCVPQWICTTRLYWRCWKALIVAVKMSVEVKRSQAMSTGPERSKPSHATRAERTAVRLRMASLYPSPSLLRRPSSRIASGRSPV